MEFCESYCILEGIPVRVLDTKTEKPPLVLLHGYLETLYVWENFLPLVQEHFRLVALDLPGHGLTGTREVNTMDFMASVVKAYLDKMGIASVSLAGHSMGGYVALAFLAHYPTYVNSLALLHSTPYPDKVEKRADREREIEVVARGGLAKLAAVALPHLFAQENRARFRDTIEEITANAEFHEPEGIIASLKGMMLREDHVETLQKAQVPLLFVFGCHDYHIPTATATELAQKFPGATTLLLEQSGHCGFLEEPEAVAAALCDYQRAV